MINAQSDVEHCAGNNISLNAEKGWSASFFVLFSCCASILETKQQWKHDMILYEVVFTVHLIFQNHIKGRSLLGTHCEFILIHYKHNYL